MARTGFRSPLYVDDDSFYLGTSLGADGKGRLHNFVANTANEPLHVNVINPEPRQNYEAVNKFNEVLSVEPGVETLINSYTVAADETFYLNRIDVSGTNSGTYYIYFDGILNAVTRTNFAGDLSTTVDFFSYDQPLVLLADTLVEVKVRHDRPDNGDFECRIFGDTTKVVTTAMGENIYDEITDVASGAETTILSYTVATGFSFEFERVEVSGTNIATFYLYVDGERIASVRNGFFSFTAEISFQDPSGIFSAEEGSIIEVKVIHSRPYAGDFEARLQGGLQA